VDDEITLQRKAAGIGHQGLDGRPDHLPKELSEEGYMFHEARRFLDQRPVDKPFFMWFSTSKPHQLYRPAKEFWDLYDGDLPMPPTADDTLDNKIFPLRKQVQSQRRNPDAETEPRTYEAMRQRKLRGYYGNVTHADWAMGQLIDELDRRGLRDDTLIVFSSDHGEFACEHGILEKAPGISADCVGRIPMIWSFPGRLPQGQVRRQLAESIDLWPTVAGLAGLPQMEMWDGHDLTDILVRDGPEVRDAAFTENAFIRCITTRQWRMTVVPAGMFPGDPVQGELYDRENDPWEQRNLYHDPAYAEVVAALKSRLLDFLMTTTRPVTTLSVTPHPSMDKTARAESRPQEAYPEDGKTSLKQIWRQIEQSREREHWKLNYL